MSCFKILIAPFFTEKHQVFLAVSCSANTISFKYAGRIQYVFYVPRLLLRKITSALRFTSLSLNCKVQYRAFLF